MDASSHACLGTTPRSFVEKCVMCDYKEEKKKVQWATMKGTARHGTACASFPPSGSMHSLAGAHQLDKHV
jgi:hypothetical protein